MPMFARSSDSWHRPHADTAPSPGSRHAPPRLVHTLLGLALTTACVLASGARGLAQAQQPNEWFTNGTVRTVVRDGGALYIGGEFTRLDTQTGTGVPLNAADGQLVPGFPKVNGLVNVAVPDGAGGWYIAGSFTTVGGLLRRGLAHIAANLSVSAWDPVSAGQVFAIVRSGST